MADLSEMTDEELNKVIESGVEPQEIPESQEEPPEAPQETGAPELPEEPIEPVEEQAVEEQPPSRREQLRINQLLAKYGPPPERQPQLAPQQSSALNYEQALDADPEIIQQLNADRQAVAQTQYNEGLKRAEYLNWATSLKIDAPRVEQQYPILDPKSTQFHPAVADALNTMYLKMSGFNPQTQTVATTDISYADFVESNMELVEEIAGQKNAQSVKNIAKQVATTGLRPDGSSAKMNLNKPPQDMTMEELYAKIGQSVPKK